MRLSIIIPVYNEKKYFLTLLNKVKNVKLPGIQKEIIIVDDCSTDGTREMVKKVKGKGIKVFFHDRNIGKGAAIRTGLQHVTGDIIIFQDADLEYNPDDYGKMIGPILDGKTKVVYGVRFQRGHKARYPLLYLGNIGLSLLASLLYGKRVHDIETCYKAFTNDIAKSLKLEADGFELEPEITSKLLKRHKIAEVPISYKSRSMEEGKKITWKDGVKALGYLLKYRFVD